MTDSPSLVDASPHLHDGRMLRLLASRDGYLFLRGVLKATQVLALRRRVLEGCAALGWLNPHAKLMEGRCRKGIPLGNYRDPGFIALQGEIQVLDEFDVLRSDGNLARALGSVLGTPVRSGGGDVVRVFSPRSPFRTAPHQDGHFFRDRPLGGIWTVWVPLGECPLALGGLVLRPGSQRGGLMTHEMGERIVTLGEDGWVTADYRCGDCVIFNECMIHRSNENVTEDRLRVSVDYRYRRE